MKTKEGESITVKEFMSRWKQGVKDITPMQLIRIQVYSQVLILVGLFSGIVICFLGLRNLWWLLLILLGGLFNQSILFYSTIQKYLLLKKLYGGKDEQESTI